MTTKAKVTAFKGAQHDTNSLPGIIHNTHPSLKHHQTTEAGNVTRNLDNSSQQKPGAQVVQTSELTKGPQNSYYNRAQGLARAEMHDGKERGNSRGEMETTEKELNGNDEPKITLP